MTESEIRGRLEGATDASLRRAAVGYGYDPRTRRVAARLLSERAGTATPPGQKAHARVRSAS